MGLCHPAVSWLLRISTKWGGLRSCDFDGSDFLKSQHTTQSAVCNHCKAVFWEFLPDEGIRALVISTHQKFSKVSSLYLLCSLISTHEKFLRIRNSQKSAPFLYCVHWFLRIRNFYASEILKSQLPFSIVFTQFTVYNHWLCMSARKIFENFYKMRGFALLWYQRIRHSQKSVHGSIYRVQSLYSWLLRISTRSWDSHSRDFNR